MKLSPRDIAFLMEALDWPGSRTVGVGVAYAESSGNSDAKNSSSTASGLWQVMASVHVAKIQAAIADSGETFKPEHRTIFNPIINTVVAAQIYSEAGGYTPWEVFNNNTYRPVRREVVTFTVDEYNAIKKKFSFLYNLDYEGGTATGTIDDDGFDIGDIPKVGAALPGLLGAGAREGGRQAGNAVGAVLGFAAQSALVVGAFILGIVLFGLGIWTLIGRPTPRKAVSK